MYACVCTHLCMHVSVHVHVCVHVSMHVCDCMCVPLYMCVVLFAQYSELYSSSFGRSKSQWHPFIHTLC